MLPKNDYFSKFATGPFVIPLLVALVGVAAFGLGRLSALDSSIEGLKIYAPEQAAGVGEARVLAAPVDAPKRPVQAPNQPKNFVASKNGTKYYAATCSGAARIKTENQVWFGSVEDATAAGYIPAANCAGI